MKLQSVLCTETLVTISFKMVAVCEILAVSCHLPCLPPCTLRYVSIKHLTLSCQILKGYVDTDIATSYQSLKEEAVPYHLITKLGEEAGRVVIRFISSR